VHAAPFEYVRASSWSDAVSALVEGGEDARVIAGGQSLVPMMMLRLAEPSVLVDVQDAGPRTIEQADGSLFISGLVRHADLEHSSEVRGACPALADAARQIGNIRVRHRGTIGGSLAHAEPTAELPCAAVALDATLTLLGPEGERELPAREFFVTHFTTELQPGEVVTGVRFPIDGPRCGSGFAEIARRAGDFATAEAAVRVTLDADGSCSDARVVVGATADRPLDVSESAGLVGAELTEETAAAAGTAVAEALDIGPGAHASADYRRQVVAVMVKRATLMAAARAASGDPEEAGR
jgi:CO/xanthine dehydrogenase FAD-binding subunit